MATATPPAPSPANPRVEDRNLLHIGIVICFGIFATTLPQPQVLGLLPLRFLLKNQLHQNADGISNFMFWCGLAWYLKPLAGVLSDAFPLRGTRRRHYILVSSVLAAISWLALFYVPRTYNALLYACIIINLFMVMASTAVGGFLVESGQSVGATGRLTALRSFVQNFASLVNGPVGGWLATAVVAGSLLRTNVTCAAVVFSVFPVVYIFLRERRVIVSSAEKLSNASKQLATIVRSRNLWFALLFIGLFYFAPGFGTPLFIRQTDMLKLSPQFIGNLGIYSGAMGIVAALIYGAAIRKVNIRLMILIGVVTNALGTLLYLHYDSAILAILIESQNGFFFTLAEVALLDLAARSTPVGCEGLGYSLILSIRNLALFGADRVGSKAIDVYHVPFNTMVYVNAGTTALVLVLLPFMPAALMRGRDVTPTAAVPEGSAA